MAKGDPRGPKRKKDPIKLPQSLQYYFSNLKNDYIMHTEGSFLFSYMEDKYGSRLKEKYDNKEISNDDQREKIKKKINQKLHSKANSFIYDLECERRKPDILSMEMLMIHCQKIDATPNELMGRYDYHISDETRMQLESFPGEFLVPIMIDHYAMVSLCLRKRNKDVKYIIMYPPLDEVYDAIRMNTNTCSFDYEGVAVSDYQTAMDRFNHCREQNMEALFSIKGISLPDNIANMYKKYYKPRTSTLHDKESLSSQTHKYALEQKPTKTNKRAFI